MKAKAAELRAELDQLGTPGRATREKSYLKSDLTHLGVPVPAIRKVAKSFYKSHTDLNRRNVLVLVEGLWAAPVHELRVVGIELLVLYSDLLREEDIDFVEELIRRSSTWALVDPLATTVTSDLIARYPQLEDRLDVWARDEYMWLRRSAMLALLLPLRAAGGDFDRFGRYADQMLDESDFFIRKAIGWVLREVSKKRPDLVYDWLAPRTHRASGVAMREAVKYLSEPQRRRLIDAYKRKVPADSLPT
ncbi:MAG: DNA alkylation repair protein [Actinomycetota bacterium]